VADIPLDGYRSEVLTLTEPQDRLERSQQPKVTIG